MIYICAAIAIGLIAIIGSISLSGNNYEEPIDNIEFGYKLDPLYKDSDGNLLRFPVNMPTIISCITRLYCT